MSHLATTYTGSWMLTNLGVGGIVALLACDGLDAIPLTPSLAKVSTAKAKAIQCVYGKSAGSQGETQRAPASV